ncbi:MAG: hypothetical protein A2W22_03765 [Candidatus Levybacteria bacterium RBG_16_35_11]|nr:MAG: hypothetical protein A2W22_03765 [Candidatus Levybacteria bacterium RBG_16_35_11]
MNLKNPGKNKQSSQKIKSSKDSVNLESLQKQAEKILLKIKKEREELRQDFGKIETFLDNLNEAVVIFDKNRNMVYANSLAARMYGYKSKKEFMSDKITRIRSTDLETGKVIPYSKWPSALILKGKVFNSMEIQIENKLDKRKWIESYSGKLIKNKNGEKFIIATVRDVTFKKRAEEIKSLVSSIVDSSNDAIIGETLNGKITSWNKGAEKLFGYKAKEIIGKNHNIIIPSQYRESKKEIMEYLAEKGKTHERLRLTKKGRIFTVSVTVSPIIIRGKIVGISKIIRDISEQKQAEAALLQSQQRLKKTQEMANLGSWDLNLINNKLTWSDEVYRIFGLKPQEFGATYEAFLNAVHPEDRKAVDRAYFGSLRQGKDSYEIEHRIVRLDGEIRTVHERCEHIRDESGKIVRSIGMVHDITDRKKIDHLKDEFISVASHELKTPVTSLKAFAEILAGRLSYLNDAQSLEYVERMKSQIEKIIELINDLMDVSRIESGQLKLSKEVFRLDEMITEAVNDIKTISVGTHQLKILENAPVSVRGDRFRLYQVIINFLVNATKYSPYGSAVLIKSKVRGKYVKISVRDRGLGISKKNHAKIFDKFFQVKNGGLGRNKGSGLGLYISSEIIKRHNSEIKVTSGEGKGSTFSFSLRIAKTN